MKNIHDCIQRAIDAKDLNPAQGRAAQGRYQQLVERYSSIMPPLQAAASAAADLKVATRKAARSRFHTVVNQLQAMRRLDALMTSAPDPAAALRNLLEWSQGSGFTGESVRSLTEAYTASINAGLRDVLDKAGINWKGTSRDAALMDDIIDELHGDATGNQIAKDLAEAVRYQQKRMRQMFNAHGGDVGELADYGVAHAHSPERVAAAGYDTWAAAIEQRLAWHKINDVTTGRPFVSAAGAIPPRATSDRFLRDVFEGITTRGWDDRTPAMQTGGTALYNQRAEARVMHFKSGADWRAYNQDFGTADPFTAMMHGLHGLARDVAMMRVLGPNPRAGLEFAVQVAERKAALAGGPKLQARVRRQAGLARTMLAHQSGAANVPEHAAAAAFFAGTRAVLTSIQLGSAVLSSVSDMATIGVAARVIGMNPLNTMSRTLKLVASQATRQTAARMGYVAQTLADTGGGSARYFGSVFGSGLPDRLAGFTLRASGLTFITDMRRISFQMEFSGFLAEHADLDFNQLPESLRQILDARQIRAADWDALRDPAVRFIEPGGADFITPEYYLENQTARPRAEAEGLAMRMRMLMAEQLEFALPTASLEGKALLQGAVPPGTIAGELLRSSTSYKSFSMSLMLNQYRRFQQQPGRWSKAKYAASIGTLLTLSGALAIQLKELAKGNDPRPMDTGVFWKAAVLQGGGLGIFGDFFASEESRTGGGIGETIAGPVVSAMGDVIGPIARNVSAAIGGKDTRVGRDVATTVRQNTPVASSLWYARLAFDRLVADQLQSFLDPDANQAWDQAVKRRRREYGTRPWWQPGDLAPSRAPDLSNAAGAQR